MPSSKYVVWLVVGNMCWGKGHTMQDAFMHCMYHSSPHSAPTPKIYFRRISFDMDAPLFKDRTREDLFDAVVVDFLGGGEWPAGAKVAKLDSTLTPILSKAYERFSDAWDDFAQCRAVGEAFDGDLGSGA